MKNKYSFLVFILISVTIITLFFRFPQSLFSYDNLGFYMYLPNFFIYKNVTLNNLDFLNNIVEQYHLTPSLYQIQPIDNGNNVNRFTMGIAILMSPFFFLAHLYALIFGYEPNGFSTPYHWMLHVGAVFYSILGFFMLRKVLLKIFKDNLVAIILLIFYTGTNIFVFVSLGNPFPHVFAFTIYTFILYFTICWHENPKAKYAIFLGLSLGILAITRISEVFALVIPLLWGVYNKETLIAKYRLLLKYRMHLLYLVMAGLIAILPQLTYWYIVTDHLLFFPYSDPQSTLELSRPRFAWVLFSYRKGWLLYSPLMTLSVLGLIILYKKHRQYFFPIITFFLINLYLIASFTSMVSYGYRAFIQSYAIMIIPFGYVIAWLLERKKIFIMVGLTAILFISYVNIFQAWQIRTGVISDRRMSKAYFWKIFLKKKADPEDRKLLLVNRFFDRPEKFENEEDFDRNVFYFNSFEYPYKGRKVNFVTDPVYSSKYSFLLDSTLEYVNVIEVPFEKITNDYYCWIRASLKVFPINSVEESDVRLVITFIHNGKSYKYNAIRLSLEQFHAKPGQWNMITWDYQTPEVISEKDLLKVYIWHRGKGEAYVDDMRLDLFTPK